MKNENPKRYEGNSLWGAAWWYHRHRANALERFIFLMQFLLLATVLVAGILNKMGVI